MALTQRYAGSAVQVLVKIMADPAAPYASKVSASVALLKFGREGVMLDDLTERIENLEAAMSAGEAARSDSGGQQTPLIDHASMEGLKGYAVREQTP